MLSVIMLNVLALSGVNFTNIFGAQTRAAFEEVFFDALDGNNSWQKCVKIWHSEQKL
jgi:hypothetical protein